MPGTDTLPQKGKGNECIGNECIAFPKSANKSKIMTFLPDKF